MIGIKGVAKKPITDATATTADVKSGKVFYNNQGKCSGTLPSELCYKEITMNLSSGNHSYDTIGNVWEVNFTSSTVLSTGVTLLSSCDRGAGNSNGYNYSQFTETYLETNIPVTNVAYMMLNGKKYIFPETFKVDSYYRQDFANISHVWSMDVVLFSVQYGIITYVAIGVNADYYSAGNLPTDCSVSIVYHD